MDQPKKSIGFLTAANLIIASMVGIGVFTTSGYMIAALQSKSTAIIVWLVGGLLALCGGLAYAELGAALPGNGGEYQLLSRIYHPIVGFMAGITSLIVGFSAPIAAYGIAFETFLRKIFPWLPDAYAFHIAVPVPTHSVLDPIWQDAVLDLRLPPVAIALVVLMSLLHSIRVETGDRWQNVMTFGKLGLIVVFCASSWFAGEHFFNEEMPVKAADAVFAQPFAIQLIWVSFSYSGWNAASYVAGELRDPAKNLPRAVALGTLVVTFLYTWMNYVFLDAAPAVEITGKEEVAAIAASHLVGASAAKLIALLIALGLVSTTGAMVRTGPRVLEAMGEQYPRLGAFARRSEGRGPLLAIWLQSGLAILLVVVTTFGELINAVGFVLTIWCFLTVLGVFVLRMREPNLPRPYRIFGYPATPLLFVALSLWMIGQQLAWKPYIAGYGAIALAAVVPLYFWARGSRTKT